VLFFFLSAIFAGVFLGLLRGGRLDGLARLQVRRPWLLAAGTLLWLVTVPLPLQLWLHLAAFAPLLRLLAQALLLLFIWQNRAIPWLLFVGLGLLANVVVMAANGGQMPVDETLMGLLGLTGKVAQMKQQGLWLHSRPIGPDTRLPFLGDVLYLGPPFPWPSIVSPGDVLIALGVFLAVQSAMLAGAPRSVLPPLGSRRQPR